ncbi:Crp/Fnr family transcriptional regulator [Methylobacterium flocculans]|uniref:Crp/Fnr family transcriptional regulator n=1 Tax=Methylobacterium flocculans TaxID=2984843 RepID=UPI0021F3476B|nr:Crp/Fnr family transcriptional regulator [Methylobacterium sp. FF17]
MTMLLRKLESIATLSDGEREAVQSLPVRNRTFGAGQDIVRDGDQPSHCCVVIDGWLFRYKILGEGRRQIFSFHIPGDTPDLQSLHLPVMDHSLGTLTQASVAFIPHESVRDLTLRFPRIGAVLWRDTLIDAAIFREWMAGMGRKSAYGRIGHLFCEMYAKLEAVGLAGDYRCPLPITQGELGDALGLSNVHINRVLQEMRGKGLITLRNNTLVVHAWAELCRSAEFDPTYLHLQKAG